MNARRALLTAVLVGWIGVQGDAAAPAKLALQGGRIITVTGEDIAQGTLLIENGKITAIGKDVEIPYDAMTVAVDGKVLFPGTISPHTWEGLDRPNESLPVVPYLDVYDALDPSSLNFENALRNGVLGMHIIQGNSCVIGGLSRLVHPIGRTPDEMTIRPGIALKMSTSSQSRFDRMSQMASMRETFLDLQEYLGDLAEKRYEAQLKQEKKELDVAPDKARELGRDLIRDQDCDDKHRNLFRLTSGRLDAWIYCGTATDVAPAIQLAKENGFLDRTVFVLGVDAYRAVKELKAAKRPVVLSEVLMHQERDPISGALRETFAPKVIHEAGIQFALQPNQSASLGEGYLAYQAARCVRHGLPRQAALKAITLNPARMLGVDDRLGSLEVGKEAYVLVLSGDPLDFNSWVEQAYIRGVLAYDRSEDVRLKSMLDLKDRFDKEEQEKAVADKAAADKAAADKAAADKAAADKAAAEKAAAEKAAAEKAAAKEPAEKVTPRKSVPPAKKKADGQARQRSQAAQAGEE